MFDFDNFVNKPNMDIFGRPVTYRPKNTQYPAFAMTGDFHESYMEIELKNAGADISSAQIVLFVRLIDFPESYPEPKQGDYVDTTYRGHANWYYTKNDTRKTRH